MLNRFLSSRFYLAALTLLGAIFFAAATALNARADWVYVVPVNPAQFGAVPAGADGATVDLPVAPLWVTSVSIRSMDEVGWYWGVENTAPFARNYSGSATFVQVWQHENGAAFFVPSATDGCIGGPMLPAFDGEHDFGGASGKTDVSTYVEHVVIDGLDPLPWRVPNSPAGPAQHRIRVWAGYSSICEDPATGSVENWDWYARPSWRFLRPLVVTYHGSPS